MTSDNDNDDKKRKKEDGGFTARCDDGQSSDVKKGTDDGRERDKGRGWGGEVTREREQHKLKSFVDAMMIIRLWVGG